MLIPKEYNQILVRYIPKGDKTILKDYRVPVRDDFSWITVKINIILLPCGTMIGVRESLTDRLKRLDYE